MILCLLLMIVAILAERLHVSTGQPGSRILLGNFTLMARKQELEREMQRREEERLREERRREEERRQEEQRRKEERRREEAEQRRQEEEQRRREEEAQQRAEEERLRRIQLARGSLQVERHQESLNFQEWALIPVCLGPC